VWASIAANAPFVVPLSSSRTPEKGKGIELTLCDNNDKGLNCNQKAGLGLNFASEMKNSVRKR